MAMMHQCQRGIVIFSDVPCCRCGKEGATHSSPSGNRAMIYCDQCCASRCGKHSIEDYVYDASIDCYVDPCVLRWRPIARKIKDYWR